MPNKNGRATEAEEQTTLFEWAKFVPELKWMFAIPNGGSRNKMEAKNLQRQGVKAGVPDIFLPLPKGEYHGLFVEMKIDKGKLSSDQGDYLQELSKNGYFTAVCYGFEAAMKTIKTYLSL